MPVETLVTLERVLEFMADRLEASQLLLVTDDAAVVRDLAGVGGVPTVVATPSSELAEDAKGRANHVLLMKTGNLSGLHVLDEVRNILLGAFLEGMLGHDDDVLCCVALRSAPDMLLTFNASEDAEFANLREGVEDRVPTAVFEAVMGLAIQLAREGREGKSIGTLFVLGDTTAVLAQSKQAVINPFQGHARQQRSIMRADVWETLKEFAQLDGAIIINEDGVVEAAGRYVTVDPAIPAIPGLGGRHLAAASISRMTGAIAVVVSQSGTVRVFRDGTIIVEIGKA